MTKDNTQPLGLLFFDGGSRVVICQRGSFVTYAFLNSDPRIFEVDYVSGSGMDIFQALSFWKTTKVYFR